MGVGSFEGQEIFLGPDDPSGQSINQLLGLNAAAGDDADLLEPHRNAILEDPTRQDRFLQWAGSVGELPNLNDDEQLRAFLLWEGQQLNQEEAPRSGSAGRVQFGSEKALDEAQIAALQFESALGSAQFQEGQRQNTIQNAMSRMELMQTTDQLADARRENAVNALQAALPFMASPGLLQNLEASNAALQQSFGEPQVPLGLTQTELPLNELANPALAGGPGQIDDALLPLLNAPPVAAPTP